MNKNDKKVLVALEQLFKTFNKGKTDHFAYVEYREHQREFYIADLQDLSKDIGGANEYDNINLMFSPQFEDLEKTESYSQMLEDIVIFLEMHDIELASTFKLFKALDEGGK